MGTLVRAQRAFHVGRLLAYRCGATAGRWAPGEKLTFALDGDTIVLEPNVDDSRIYLRRGDGPLITVLRTDPWNPPAAFTIDGSEPIFRGFAEWLSGAIVSQGLDEEIVLRGEEGDEDDEDEASEKRIALSQWLLFHDADRDEQEQSVDWRLGDSGMVSSVCYADVAFLAVSDADYALAYGAGRDAYYAFIRERIDPDFGPR